MEFLRLLVECDRVDYIRVDSNGSTVDRLAGELWSPKIHLMCTFHPSQVTLDKFLERVDVTQQAGMLDMVNFVAVPRGYNKSEIDRLVRAFAERGIFMNVAYDFFQPGEYRLADMRHLLSLRTRRDAEFTLKCETLGEVCAAGVSYVEIELDGSVRRCRQTRTLGNLFEHVDLLGQAEPCTFPTCNCIERYTQLLSWRGAGDRHLTQYVSRNREHRRGLPETDWTAELGDGSIQQIVKPPLSVRAQALELKVPLSKLRRRAVRKAAKVARGVAGRGGKTTR